MSVIYFYWFQYLRTYAVFFHELCHWIVGFLWYILGYSESIPTIVMIPPTIQYDQEEKCYNQCSIGGICYSQLSKKDEYSWKRFLICIAPLFGTILLFLYSPDIIRIYIGIMLPTFLPSKSDWDICWDILGRKLLLWH